MSYSGLLKHRCRILELTDFQLEGVVSNDWTLVDDGDNIHCFLDLGFIRLGRDPQWVPDSNTAQNRSGVLFLAPGAPAMPGNRIEIIKGPQGTFEIDSSMDEAWTPTKLHHLECFVSEVNRVYVSGGN